jgi:hypothetical protein
MKLEFEEFWNKLVEHEIWFDQMKMRFNRKDLKTVARDCYLFLLASEQRWISQDYQDFRKCYQSFLMKSPDLVVRPQLQQVEQKKDEPQEPIVTGEKRDEYINQWLQSVKEMKVVSSVPKLTHKEISDEGDWLPKKPAPYPMCSEAEVIKIDLHIAYIKQNYDARTGEKLACWMPESEWKDLIMNDE